MSKPKQPVQPVVMVKDVARFQQNDIVRYLFDNGGISLTTIESLPFRIEDRMQFEQLIGRSVCGFEEVFGDFPEAQPIIDDAVVQLAGLLAQPKETEKA